MAVQEKLAADFPAVPRHRFDLAWTCVNLAGVLAGQRDRAGAEEQYRRGLTLFERLAADFPTIAAYRTELGGSYCNFAVFVRDGGRPAESVAWFERAIATLGPVHEKLPEEGAAKHFLRDSHGGRAKAYEQLGRYAEAVTDWDRVVELSGATQHPQLLAQRVRCRTRAGQVAEAVAEVAELRKQRKWDGPQLYHFACVYAVASDKIAEEKQRYADRAMELLLKAVKAGYKDTAKLKADADLDPIRGRDDFKTLVAELEAKFPPPRELLPPPRPAK